MFNLGSKKLEKIFPGLVIPHHPMTTRPCVAVVFDDVLSALQQRGGMESFRVVVPMKHNRRLVETDDEPFSLENFEPPCYWDRKLNMSAYAKAVFVPNGKLCTVTYEGYPKNNRKMPEGINVITKNGAARRMVRGVIDEVVGGYTADKLWDTAVSRVYCDKTAKQNDADLTAFELGKGQRYVRLLACDQDYVWTFDGKKHLWDWHNPKNKHATMAISVGGIYNVGGGSGKVVAGAELKRNLVKKDLDDFGLVSASMSMGYNGGRSNGRAMFEAEGKTISPSCRIMDFFYADPTRVRRLRAAYQQLCKNVGVARTPLARCG